MSKPSSLANLLLMNLKLSAPVSHNTANSESASGIVAASVGARVFPSYYLYYGSASYPYGIVRPSTDPGSASYPYGIVRPRIGIFVYSRESHLTKPPEMEDGHVLRGSHKGAPQSPME
jgi:hypothetical protein